MEFDPSRLRIAMLVHHMEHQDLAERIGLSDEEMLQIEGGVVLPEVSDLCKICEVLRVSSDFLLGQSSFSELDGIFKR